MQVGGTRWASPLEGPWSSSQRTSHAPWAGITVKGSLSSKSVAVSFSSFKSVTYLQKVHCNLSVTLQESTVTGPYHPNHHPGCGQQVQVQVEIFVLIIHAHAVIHTYTSKGRLLWKQTKTLCTLCCVLCYTDVDPSWRQSWWTWMRVSVWHTQAPWRVWRHQRTDWLAVSKHAQHILRFHTPQTQTCEMGLMQKTMQVCILKWDSCSYCSTHL